MHDTRAEDLYINIGDLVRVSAPLVARGIRWFTPSSFGLQEKILLPVAADPESVEHGGQLASANLISAATSPNMVFTQWPSAHLRPLATLADLGTISGSSGIVRFV